VCKAQKQQLPKESDPSRHNTHTPFPCLLSHTDTDTDTDTPDTHTQTHATQPPSRFYLFFKKKENRCFPLALPVESWQNDKGRGSKTSAAHSAGIDHHHHELPPGPSLVRAPFLAPPVARVAPSQVRNQWSPAFVPQETPTVQQRLADKTIPVTRIPAASLLAAATAAGAGAAICSSKLHPQPPHQPSVELPKEK